MININEDKGEECRSLVGEKCPKCGDNVNLIRSICRLRKEELAQLELRPAFINLQTQISTHFEDTKRANFEDNRTIA